jgi:multidrug efflux system membrane fusion protein
VTGAPSPITGELTFIDNAVDPASGTIAAKATFSNAGGALTPGQFAQLTVQLDTLTKVLAVPAQAVESGVEGPYLFIVNADSSVTLRQVKVGPVAGGYQVVKAGVAKGERVVTSGQARLRDKSKVAVGGPEAAATVKP